MTMSKNGRKLSRGEEKEEATDQEELEEEGR